MRIREIAFVLLRIVAIWIFIDLALPNLFSSVFYLSSNEIFPNKNGIILFYSSQAVLFLCLSLILWFFTNNISEKIISPNIDISVNVKNEVFIEVALSVIGIYLIASHLPSFISNIFSLLTEQNLPTKNYNSNTKYLIQSFIGIVIGFICITGKIDILKLINKLRSAGVKEAL